MRTKLLGLVTTANGGFACLQLTRYHRLFGVLLASTGRRAQTQVLRPTFVILSHLDTMSELSLLAKLPGQGAIYARSGGVSALLITHNYLKQTTTVRLPSGVLKVFSVHTVAMLGGVAFGDKVYCVNTKYGSKGRWGTKPVVRGVANNPTDHPHGGRTKAIKYPRTPWGRTTKFK